MAQIRKNQSHFGAYSIGFGVLTALTLMCSAPAVLASSDDPFTTNGYQAGMRITIPFGGDNIKQDEATFALTAGSTSKHILKTDDFAYLSFTADGYFKKAQLGSFSVAMPLRTVKTTRINHNRVRIASARRYYQRTARPSRQQRCGSGALQTSGHFKLSRRQRLQASYCYALRKHSKMIAAYERFKRIKAAKQPVKKMLVPELAGGPKSTTMPQTKKSKHAYFDYWVSRKAYQQALGDYRALLVSKRKSRSRR